MSKPGFFFYTGDYIKDTRVLSAEARGCWMDALCFLYENGGSVSWPIMAYANFWGVSEEQARWLLDSIAMAKVGNVLWQDDSKTIANLSNRRMMREAQKRLETKEKRSEAGKKGAAKRWQKCDSSSSSSESSSYSSFKEVAEAATLPASPTVKNDKSSDNPKRDADIEAIFKLAKEIAGSDSGRAKQLCDFVGKTIREGIHFGDSKEVVHAAILETFQSLKAKAEKDGHVIDEVLLWPYLQKTYKYRRTTEITRESENYKKADIGSFGEVLSKIRKAPF